MTGLGKATGLVTGLALALSATLVLVAEPPFTPEVSYVNQEYNGRFTFARIRFEPTQWGPGPFFWNLDLKWNHDYPFAEINFAKILREITSLDANLGRGSVLRADDPELFNYPWAYLCEVGFWRPTPQEVRALRQYLLKGGFLVVDDFIDLVGDDQWYNFEVQIKRVLPEARLIELDASHPVFHSFFQLDDLNFDHPILATIDTRYYGIFEDNDPKKRLMVIANYNNDIGDFWEWSDQDLYPVDLTQKGFQLGVNYVIYGMTH